MFWLQLIMKLSVTVCPDKSQKLIKLKKVTIGCRRIRYIRVPLSTVLSQDGSLINDASNSASVVFFLGCDILAGTTISTKNSARQHLKFANENYCCKITFPERLAGIAGSTKAAWFYTIHGVIKCAFDFYDLDRQILMMKHFFNTWSNEPNLILPKHFAVTEEDLLSEELLLTVLTKNSDSCDMCDKNEMAASRNKQEKEVQCDVTLSLSTDKTHVTCDSSSQTCYDDIPTDTSKNDITPDSAKEMCHIELNIASAAVGSPFKNIKNLAPGNWSSKLLSSLSSCLHSYFNQASADIVFYKVFSLVDTFLSLITDELVFIESSTTGIFPFHFLMDYAAMKTSVSDKKSSMESAQLDLYYHECVLHIVSKWLASQFHEFQTVISLNLENFKKQQMIQNKTVVDPVEIITQHNLFPSCMVAFISQWMGGLENESEKLIFCSRLLLILELVNEALLTGMGHVVYAKLKCNNTM